MLEGWGFPDITLYLVAVLGLLVLWQYYQLQILAGRILAVDIFDRSGIRMYLYVMPEDDQRCENCSKSQGLVFAPSQVAKQGFSPHERPCTGSVPCLGVLVGLYGGWLEARAVVERLRANLKKGRIRLTEEELRALVNGDWENSISAETDRLGVRMIEAICYEQINPAISIGGYRFVVDEAKEVRHLLLFVPAYLRLAPLLVRDGEYTEAVELIERFETRFPVTRRGRHFPSAEQRDLMQTRKTHLLNSQASNIPA